MTVKEWFFSRHSDRSMRIMTAVQRSVGIVGGVIVLAALMLAWAMGFR